MSNQYRRLDRKDLIDHSKRYENAQMNTEKLTPADLGIVASIEAGDISMDVIARAMKTADRKLALDVMYNIDPDLVEQLIIHDLTYTNMFFHYAMTYPAFRKILMLDFVKAVMSTDE